MVDSTTMIADIGIKLILVGVVIGLILGVVIVKLFGG